MKRLLRNLCLALFACHGLVGCALILCAIDTNITHQPRFAQVTGREIHASKKLYLFEPEISGTEKMRRFYSLSADRVYYGQKRIAEVPAGHPMRFDKVMRKHDIEATWDTMYGEISLNGRTYPLSLYLGGSVYPDEWRHILFNCFGVRE